MNFQVTITTDESSKRYLAEKLDWILDLMDKEHHHCSTHSQRNMYQAVIRHELELMRDEVRYADIARAGNAVTGVSEANEQSELAP